MLRLLIFLVVVLLGGCNSMPSKFPSVKQNVVEPLNTKRAIFIKQDDGYADIKLFFLNQKVQN